MRARDMIAWRLGEEDVSTTVEGELTKVLSGKRAGCKGEGRLGMAGSLSVKMWGLWFN